MKKIFLLATAIIAICAMSVNAQDIDPTVIAKMRKVKADSISQMMGTVYASQAAMNHTDAAARQEILKGFNEVLGLDKKGEQFKEGNAIASEFFKVSQDMNNRNGIVMNRKEYAQALLARFNDSTITANINEEVREINTEAKRLIEELTALHKDSLAPVTQAPLIALKSDSLSRNMGRFYGMQLAAMTKKKNLTEEQRAQLIEGFNNAINVDESNKALINGKMIGNDFMNIEQNIKKQLDLNLDKDIFAAAVASVLNDTKVPTLDEFNALNSKTSSYMQETQKFARETSAEALMHRTMGQKYIEKQLNEDPGFAKTPSGLVYKVLTPGNGKKFNADDKIKVMYKGTHVDGNTFDESKEPVTFSPNQVVPGFREALLMMSPGSKMIAILPQDLAYGARGAGKDIKPFETLVFEIETLGIDENAAKEAKKEVKKENTVKTESVKPAATDKKASKTTGKKIKSKKKSSKRK